MGESAAGGAVIFGVLYIHGQALQCPSLVVYGLVEGADATCDFVAVGPDPSCEHRLVHRSERQNLAKQVLVLLEALAIASSAEGLLGVLDVITHDDARLVDRSEHVGVDAAKQGLADILRAYIWVGTSTKGLAGHPNLD
eukprot:2483473-Alexandrium_andersonii.AAC.1